MSARRVLVTGASGFIGRHCLLPLRERGYEIVAARRRRDAGEGLPQIDGLRWIDADLLAADGARQLLAEAGASHLLHLAWTVEPGKMISDPANLAWLRASIDLMQRFHESGGQRIVVGGSCYEYDWRFGYCNEQLTLRIPDTLYGAAKNSLYEALTGYAASVGMEAAWGRMFFLFGPGENRRRLVPSVVLSLLRGEPALASHGLQIRDYLPVQDVADGMVALLDSGARGGYNIAGGQATTIGSILDTLGTITGRPELIRKGALAARANDAPMVVGDPAAARRDFGWQAKTSLHDGLSATVDWWRHELARHSGSTR